MIQRPRSLPLAPRIPAGLATPALLRQLAAIAEKYQASIKIAGNSIVLLGLSAENRALALTELGVDSQSLSAKAVRSVAVCAGKPHCPRAVQDSTALGLAIEERFYGLELPGKLRIGVSGCPNCCAEVFVKDIGLYGVAAGYTLVAGGNAGRQAQAARTLAEKVPAEAVLPLIGRIIAYYQKHGRPGERLGQTMARLGFEDFAAFVGVN